MILKTDSILVHKFMGLFFVKKRFMDLFGPYLLKIAVSTWKIAITHIENTMLPLIATNYRPVFLTVVNYCSFLFQLQLIAIAISTYFRHQQQFCIACLVPKTSKLPTNSLQSHFHENQPSHFNKIISIINPFNLQCSLYKLFCCC